jgi:exopolysaccharide biosynthesis WecB/TagA/CpsF family protein
MKTIASKIVPANSDASAIKLIEKEISQNTVSIVSFLNAHAYTLANKSNEFLDCLLTCDLLFRDGIGAKFLLKKYNKTIGYNANGTDLIPLILREFHSYKFCFIGTESPYIENAAELCKQNGNKVIATMDGFQDTNTMMSFVEQHKPDILILGMGMPKQELFSRELQKNYKQPLVVVNGGAIFDFLANRVKRAPELFRRLNIEWLYRLANEPKRLFSRYVIGIPKFFWLLRKNAARE